MVNKNRIITTIITNLLSIIATYYISILLHEFAHGTVAWIYSYKSSPFNIYYGNWFLLHVSEAVNYKSILASGHGNQEALIGISGITVSTILFLISFSLLKSKPIYKNFVFLAFFFWLADINLMEMFSYLNRTFMMGDVGELIQGLNISPLWIFIPGCAVVANAIYYFYQFVYKKWFNLLNTNSVFIKRLFLCLTFWPLLFSIIYSETPLDWKLLSYTTNFFSIVTMIYIIKVCDPGCHVKNPQY